MTFTWARCAIMCQTR